VKFSSAIGDAALYIPRAVSAKTAIAILPTSIIALYSSIALWALAAFSGSKSYTQSV
jgi:hypothetical protein